MNTVATEMNNSTPTTSTDWYRNYVWLVRRELWEHRRFFMAPLIVSAVIIIAVLFAMTQMGHDGITMNGSGIHFKSSGGDGNFKVSNEVAIRGAHLAAFVGFAFPFFIVTFLVTLHYALDTLYADRRDRSILFWKSLPVSDVETVLSKLFVASVVSILVAIVISVATQFIVYILMSIGLAVHGLPVSVLWTGVPFIEGILLLLYAAIVVGLWYLPIWAWCMLASSWAQRAVFLWAGVPFAAAWFLEYETLGTNHVAEFLRTRTSGMWELAAHGSPAWAKEFSERTLTSLHITDFITPGVFFSSPQLWIGFLITAGLVAATVWVRRFRETA